MNIPTSALFFDVRKHGLNTATAAELGLDGAFTVEGWFMVDTFSHNEQTVLRTKDGGVRCVIFERKATLHVGSASVATEVNLKPKRWYHLAWRYHPAKNELAVYVDGLADIRSTATTSYSGNDKVQIGHGPGRVGLVGGIAQLRVWSYVRSDDDLRAASYHDVEDDPAGLVAHWRPGEAKDGVVTDASGAGHDATFVNRPLAKPATLPDLDEVPVFGPNDRSALHFPDNTTHVRLLSAEQLGLTNASFTIEAWVKLDKKTSDDESLLGTNGYLEPDALTLSVRRRRMFMGFGVENKLRSDVILEIDTWYHLVWRYDVRNGEMAMFVDGEQVAADDGHAPLQAKGTLNIARSQNHQQLFGSIAEVRSWDHARDDDAIRANRDEPPTASEVGLTGYWKPGEVAGRTVPDRSRWGRHGILEGAAFAEPAPEVPPGPKRSLPPMEGMFANTRNRLYTYDPNSRDVAIIGRFHSDVAASVIIYGLAFMPDGRCIAMGKWRLYECDITTAHLTQIGDRTEGNVYAITSMPDGRLIGLGAGTVVELDTTTAKETVLWLIDHENHGGVTVLPNLTLLTTQVLERSYNFGGDQTDPEVLGRSEWQIVDLDAQEITKLDRVNRAISGIAYADGPIYASMDRETAIVDADDQSLSALIRHPVTPNFTGLSIKRQPL